MAAPSASRKTIAAAAAAAFGGRPSVNRFWDDRRGANVDVLACPDSPAPGVTSYATIGMSETALAKEGKKANVRAELVGACASRFTEFANYLSTAAFCVVNSGWVVAPGIVFPDVLSMYRASRTMKHFLFLPPFLWEGRLRTLAMGTKKVAWLLAVPISDAELELAKTKGVPALEELLEKHRIDVFDLARPSVV